MSSETTPGRRWRPRFWVLALLVTAARADATDDNLSNRDWLDAVLREEARERHQPAEQAQRPFFQDREGEHLILPFLPLSRDWLLTESRIRGNEGSWIWHKPWGRGDFRLALTRRGISGATPLAVRRSLHFSATRLRCNEPVEEALVHEALDPERRWYGEIRCTKEHGGELRQLLLVLAGQENLFELSVEWHDRVPEAAVIERWRTHLAGVTVRARPGSARP